MLTLTEKGAFYAASLSVIAEPNSSKLVVFTCLWFVVSSMQIVQEALMALTLMTTRNYNMDLYVYGTRCFLYLSLLALSFGVVRHGGEQLDFLLLALLVLTGIQIYKFYLVEKDWLEGEEEML